MSRVTYRFMIGLLVLFLMTLSLLLVISVAQPVTAQGPERVPTATLPPEPVPTPLAHLELEVEPSAVTPGTPFTLYIAYRGLGLPQTTITVDPPELATYDPPLSMPCDYQHPNGCTAIRMRALAPGLVTFTAWANGEVYDPECMCWRWYNAFDDGPAHLLIAETIYQVALPIILKSSP